jgi:uncharacterized protein YydD (DUF2326 family)
VLISVSSNKSQFKKVTFTDGVNVILADTSKEAGKKDSRNGVGKSSLINIIHFCLGANVTEGKGIAKSELSGWDFTLELKITDQVLKLTREIDDHSKVYFLCDDKSSLPMQPIEIDGRDYFSAENINKLLGNLFFGLSVEPSKKYSPSNRMALSYLSRKGIDAYSTPFKYFPMQGSWQVQVSQAFLLGLSYEIAQEISLCKDEEKTLKDLKTSLENGMLESIVGDLGRLEAEKVQVDTKVEAQSEQLKDFKVHPQYNDVENEVNSLTQKIHKLSNNNILNKDLLISLKKSTNVEQQKVIDSTIVKKMYEEAGAVFKEDTISRLDDVIKFHEQLIANRKEFLKDELKRLVLEIKKNTEGLEEYSTKRAELLSVLDEHGAFEDMVKLQNLQTGLVTKSKSLENRIKDLKKIRNAEQEIKLKKDGITLKANIDYDDREEERKNLIKIFAQNTANLYGKSGNLIINIDSSGYKFKIEMERDGSAGVNKMEIFCYDLMIAELWSSRNKKPGFLIHDSTIFSDVDERQISSAINLAKAKSSQLGFQYICCMNSDKIPEDIKKGSPNIFDDVVLTLSDNPESECLFGFRF